MKKTDDDTDWVKAIDTLSLKFMMMRSWALDYDFVITDQQWLLLDTKGVHLVSDPILIWGDRVRCRTVLLRLKDQEQPWKTSLDFTLDDYQCMPDYEGQENIT